MTSYRLAGLIVLLLAALAGCVPVAAPAPGPSFTATVPTAAPRPQPSPATPAAQDTPAPPAVTTAADLLYTRRVTGPVLEQKLDVYAHEDGDSWPVVVLAHGLMQGKQDFARLGRAIAEQGAVVFTLNWPVYSGTAVTQQQGQKLREMSETLVCGVRFAQAHAAEVGGDPNRLILAGFSAGAGMGALVALGGEGLGAEWEELAAQHDGEPARQIECVAPEASAHVDAFVGIAGPYSAFDQLADSVPDLGRVVGVGAHLGQNPGLLVRLIHGRHDATVPFSVSEDFADALAAAGYDATLTPVDEGHKVPWDETLAAISQLVNSLDSRASD